MTLISRRPDWLFEALRMQEPQLVTDIDSQAIQPSMDVYQDGWGLARYIVQRYNTGVFGATTLVAIPDFSFPPAPIGSSARNEPVVRKVFAIAMFANPLTAATTLSWKYRRFSDLRVVTLRNLSITTGDFFDWTLAISNGVRDWTVPPGLQLICEFGGTGNAGDTVSTEILWAEAPSGFGLGA